MVESGETEIAVSRLLRLVEAYGVLAIDVLAEAAVSTAPEFVPAEQSYRVPSELERVRLEFLSSGSWRIQPFRLDLEPGAKIVDLSHRGDEFLYALEGETTIQVDGDRFTLSPGDTLVIPEKSRHSYVNSGKQVSRLLGGVGHDLVTQEDAIRLRDLHEDAGTNH